MSIASTKRKCSRKNSAFMALSVFSQGTSLIPRRDKKPELFIPTSAPSDRIVKFASGSTSATP